jgi:hypothetical protein
MNFSSLQWHNTYVKFHQNGSSGSQIETCGQKDRLTCPVLYKSVSCKSCIRTAEQTSWSLAVEGADLHSAIVNSEGLVAF